MQRRIAVGIIKGGKGRLIADNGTTYEVPLSWLPPNVQTGDVLSIWGGLGSIRFSVEQDAEPSAYT